MLDTQLFMQKRLPEISWTFLYNVLIFSNLSPRSYMVDLVHQPSVIRVISVSASVSVNRSLGYI